MAGKEHLKDAQTRHKDEVIAASVAKYGEDQAKAMAEADQSRTMYMQARAKQVAEARKTQVRERELRKQMEQVEKIVDRHALGEQQALMDAQVMERKERQAREKERYRQELEMQKQDETHRRTKGVGYGAYKDDFGVSDKEYLMNRSLLRSRSGASGAGGLDSARTGHSRGGMFSMAGSRISASTRSLGGRSRMTGMTAMTGMSMASSATAARSRIIPTGTFATLEDLKALNDPADPKNLTSADVAAKYVGVLPCCRVCLFHALRVCDGWALQWNVRWYSVSALTAH